MYKKLPSSYYMGQEFIEDKNRIEVIISFYLFSNVFLAEFESAYKEGNIKGIHNREDFVIIYERRISQRLFEYIKDEKGGKHFIYGYFDDILPIVNNNVNIQKYLYGHILNRPISCFDIKRTTILNKNCTDLAVIEGPLVFDNFPKSKELAKDSDSIYIREFIDAITSHLYNNYDDCIRKLITSLENFFTLHNFRGTFQEKLDEITSSKYCPHQWKSYMNILNSNMKFIYRVRNKIVHDELRVTYDKNWSGVCNAGIGTLNYIYQNSLNKNNAIQYIQSLISQLILMDNYTSGLSLDNLEEYIKENSLKKTKVARSPADINEFMFSGLQIPDHIKNSILS